MAKIDALKKACVAHTNNTRECSKAHGCDRHLYALFSVWQREVDDAADQASSVRTTDDSSDGSADGRVSSPAQPAAITQSMPLIFADSGWDKLNNTIISTSNCGNPSLRQFGFGPTSGDGFGIGYIIKDDGISICASSKHRQTKRFVDAIEAYLLEIRRVLKTQRRPTETKQTRAREASANRPKGHRIKSRGRMIKAGDTVPRSGRTGAMTPRTESAMVSEDEDDDMGGCECSMLLYPCLLPITNLSNRWIL